MKVPFLDIKIQNEALRDEILPAIEQVIEQGAFAGGPFVEQFEKDFAAYCGASHALGVSSGTDALWLTLVAKDIGPGDEVITVPSTFMATAEAISKSGARPVFVDIDERNYNMDPELLEKAITKRTRMIIPVHLCGQPADMDPILAIAAKHGIPVVEDACQAHGAEYRGRRAGTLGIAGCFSFYPGKNLGAFGEAGAVVTDDSELYEKMRILRDHGQVRKYHHTMIGWNCRMDGIQGAVLQVKLRHLDGRNKLRRTWAAQYDRALAGCDAVVTPWAPSWVHHVYHLYAIRTADRDGMIRSLAARGIGIGIHYPVPVHLQEAYRGLGLGKGSFPRAEKCAEEFISLPMFPELTAAQVEAVTDAVLDLAEPMAARAGRHPVAAA